MRLSPFHFVFVWVKHGRDTKTAHSFEMKTAPIHGLKFTNPIYVAVEKRMLCVCVHVFSCVQFFVCVADSEPSCVFFGFRRVRGI